jgi:hypothetical protein
MRQRANHGQQLQVIKRGKVRSRRASRNGRNRRELANYRA